MTGGQAEDYDDDYDDEYDEEDVEEDDEAEEDEEDDSLEFRQAIAALADIESMLRARTAPAIVAMVREWCVQNAIAPEEKLVEAVDEMISQTDALGALPRLEPPSPEQGEEARKLAAAMDQVDRFVKSFGSYKAAEKAIQRFVAKANEGAMDERPGNKPDTGP